MSWNLPPASGGGAFLTKAHEGLRIAHSTNSILSIEVGRWLAGTITTECPAMTKDFSTDWAQGTGNGARDTSTAFGSDAWIYVHIIKNGDAVDYLASTSATTPTLPSGWTRVDLLTAWRSDASGNLMDAVEIASSPTTRICDINSEYSYLNIISFDSTGALTPQVYAGFSPPGLLCRPTITFRLLTEKTYFRIEIGDSAANANRYIHQGEKASSFSASAEHVRAALWPVDDGSFHIESFDTGTGRNFLELSTAGWERYI